MRVICLSLVASLVGCTSQDASDFEFRTDFNKRTKGLVLHEDGESGHAGMFGTNCPFDTKSGGVTGDYDLPGEGEEIQDGEQTELGAVTLVAIISGQVHVLDKTHGIYTHLPLDTEDVLEARLVADGVVILRGDCQVQRLSMEGVVQSTVTVEFCLDAGIEVDPLTGVGVVADPGGTVLVDGDGALPLDTAGDIVAWDASVQAFYVATRGEPILSALEADGALRWSVDTEFPVRALDDAGLTGAAAVVLALPSGRGEIAFYDGLTGALTKSGETPSAADDVAVSNNGGVIALVRPEQSFFFDILP